MIRKITIFLFIFLFSFGLFAQANVGVSEPEAKDIGVDSAQQKLKEISIDKFEDPGFWFTAMARDMGFVTLKKFKSPGPMEKEPIPEEQELGFTSPDENVLGLKVRYYKRGMASFSAFPVRPLPVEGITKTISLWVVGRNSPHVLKLIISDYFGQKAELTVGKLNFTGWRKMTVAVPPHIKQKDYHYGNKMGIKVVGLKVECDPRETYGTYYIYFDDMRAVTDLFSEESRDTDDMQDGW